MSEFLERIHREIGERLAAGRAAVAEHERLEAALRALEGVGSRATGALSRGGNQRPRERASRPAGKRSGAATGRAVSTAPGTAKRGPTAARARAPRGANRAAVLNVIGERPGVSAHELAAASGVSGGTLYALLRTLAQRGEIQKQDLPSGHAGYTLAATPAAAVPPPASTAEDTHADGEPTPASAAGAEGDEQDATPTRTDDSGRVESASGAKRARPSADTG